MNLKELRDLIDKVISKDADAINARVLVDTEARRFNAHMIEATGFWHLEKETGLGNIVYLTLNYDGSED